MPSPENFGPQFFHGTRKNLPTGGYLISHSENRGVHFTSDAEHAYRWAADSEGNDGRQVYEVHPEGDVDPGYSGDTHFRSTDPVRIGRRVR